LKEADSAGRGLFTLPLPTPSFPEESCMDMLGPENLRVTGTSHDKRVERDIQDPEDMMQLQFFNERKKYSNTSNTSN
jgi:hypothetical protein